MASTLENVRMGFTRLETDAEFAARLEVLRPRWYAYRSETDDEYRLRLRELDAAKYDQNRMAFESLSGSTLENFAQFHFEMGRRWSGMIGGPPSGVELDDLSWIRLQKQRRIIEVIPELPSDRRRS